MPPQSTAPETNPYDLVQEFYRALYGDKASRNPGLFDRLDDLNKELDRLTQKLEVIENRKPDVTNWTIGYVAFIVSGLFAIIAIVNQLPRNTIILNIPSELAALFSIVGVFVALYFFLTGYGWIGGKNGSR